mgnify:CR=1 FL=1
MNDTQGVKRVIMDTNYWIDLKENPEQIPRFFEAVDGEDVKVALSFGNFIDLVKAPEQEVLSKLIAGAVDYCLPPLPSRGNEYIKSGTPLSLIPDEEFREFAAEQTANISMVETLQYIFYSSGWEPTEEFYDGIEQYRDLTQEYGYENLKGLAFKDHLEETEDGEKLVLHEHKIDIVEYVKGEMYLQRLQLMDAQENPDANDVADLEICTQAILSDCNMLLMEEKWVNEELVERVLDSLDTNNELDVYKDFDKFVSDLSQ